MVQVERILMKSYRNKGMSLAKLEYYGEALKCFDKALNIDSNDYLSLYNKAYTLSEMDKDIESIEYYDRTIEILERELISEREFQEEYNEEFDKFVESIEGDLNSKQLSEQLKDIDSIIELSFNENEIMEGD